MPWVKPTIHESILAVYDQLPPSERKLADITLSKLSNLASYSATELAAELNVSAQAVGRLATMHNLKVAGFGGWRLSKAPNGKQIEIWGYNAAGRARLLELMEKSHDATCSTISSPAVHSSECLSE